MARESAFGVKRRRRWWGRRPHGSYLSKKPHGVSLDLREPMTNGSIDMDTSTAWSLLNRGIRYVNRQEYDRAVQVLSSAVESGLNEPDGYLHLGLALAGLGQHDQAISNFGKALKLKADLGVAYYQRALSLRAKGQNDLALADARRAQQAGVDIKPDDPVWAATARSLAAEPQTAPAAANQPAAQAAATAPAQKATKWYYRRKGKEHGPVPAGRLKELAQAGKLAPSDLIKSDAMAEWVPASSAKRLVFSQAPKAADPPSQQPQAAPAPAAGPKPEHMWFILNKHGDFGPVTFARLQSLAAAGKLKPTDWLRKDGTDVCIMAGTVKILQLPSTPPAAK
jgi:tetratricopeptide (TPR) repeat protein